MFIAIFTFLAETLLSQAVLQHGNTDIIINDNSNDPIIQFDLGTEAVDNSSDCTINNWDWRYYKRRLEPNLTDYTAGSTTLFGRSLFIGWLAGNADDLSNNQSTFIGNFCGQSNTSGGDNVGLGYQSLMSNTTGGNNVALGTSALRDNVSGNWNIAVGREALVNCENHRNIGIGYQSLFNTTSGSDNVGIGYRTGHSNISGSNNIAIGFEALFSSETEVQNIAIGRTSLANLTSGDYNVATGGQSGNSLETGSANTFIGYDAGKNVSQASFNTSVGSFAGANDSGNNNVLIGYGAGSLNNESGTDVLGEKNVIIGALAGSTDATGGEVPGSGNVLIGYGAAFEQDISNKLWIENTTGSTPLVYGDFSTNQVAINTTSFQSGYELTVNGAIYASGMITSSDERLKSNMNQLNAKETLDKVLKLKGVTYNWNDNVTGYKRPTGLQYGFSAQEIQKLYPDLVAEGNDGYLLTKYYGALEPMLVECIRALNERIDELESKLADNVEERRGGSEISNSNPVESVVEITLKDVKSIVLKQNSPNPFSEMTTISLSIPSSVQQAYLIFHDNNGRLIGKYEMEQRNEHSVIIYGDDLSSGLYTYSLVADGEIVETLRMTKLN